MRMSEDSMMSIETNHPPLMRRYIPYNKQFVLYSKNLLPQLQPILLFITEQAEIPMKHFMEKKEGQVKGEKQQQVMQPYSQQGLSLPLEKPLATNELVVKSSPLPEALKLSTRYPIFKLLKAISRIFLLNQLQLIFFSKVLTLTEWNFNHTYILKVNHLFYSFIAYEPTIRQQVHYKPKQKYLLKLANTERQAQFRKLCLYIMLAAYCAKYYFMEKDCMEDYLKQASRYMMDFEFVFRKWMMTYKNMRDIISPKGFNQTHMNVVSMQHKDSLNHNLCIDLILQLSPAYTAKEKPN